MNQIMLRFRPIAPKPAGTGASFSDAADEQRKNGKRTKRKYVRVRNNRRSRVKETATQKSAAVENDYSWSPEKRPSVTLQLLPERSETDHDNSNNTIKPEKSLSQVMDIETTAFMTSLPSVACCWIIVECVTEISSGVKLGFSDRDKIKGLELDTCPGFVSNGVNNVIWVNDAYKRMVGSLMVRLVVKEMLLPRFCPSFACRVTLIQRTKRGQKWNRIVPCDVWRMEEFAGFAWRLDVNTSIGLGF